MELGSLRWKSAPFASFSTIVEQVFQLSQANRSIFQSRGWPIKRHEIEDWVDRKNAERCQQNGWHDFYLAEAPPPEHSIESKMAQWPLWARMVAQRRQPGHVGVGDTVEHIIKETGIDFKTWYRNTFNRACGCCDRQQAMNQKYKY